MGGPAGWGARRRCLEGPKEAGRREGHEEDGGGHDTPFKRAMGAGGGGGAHLSWALG